MRKITFIRFGDLSNNLQNLGGIYLSLIKRLAEDNLLEVFTIYGHELVQNTNIRIFSFNSLISRVYRKIVEKLFSEGMARYLFEVCFDIWVCKRFDKNTDIIFIDRPICPLTQKKAKKYNIKIISIASVPHPLFNYIYVFNEAHRLGLRSKSAYLNKKWIKVILESLELIDKLLILSSKNKYYYQTYTSFIPENKIRQISNYFKPCQVYQKQITSKKKHFIFLHLSHMNLIKGVQYLLEAWKIIDKEYLTRAKLILAGRRDSDIEKLLKIRKYDLTNVEIIGYVENRDHLYAYADVFISPSISDAGPQTVIEALSYGIPIICSDHCGISDLIVNGVNGFIYHYNDVKDLKDKIEFFIKNPEYIDKKKVENSLADLSTEKFIEELRKRIIYD